MGFWSAAKMPLMAAMLSQPEVCWRPMAKRRIDGKWAMPVAGKCRLWRLPLTRCQEEFSQALDALSYAERSMA